MFDANLSYLDNIKFKAEIIGLSKDSILFKFGYKLGDHVFGFKPEQVDYGNESNQIANIFHDSKK